MQEKGIKNVLLVGAHSYIGRKLAQYQEDAGSGIRMQMVSASDGSWENMDFFGYDTVVLLAALVHRKEKKIPAEEYDRINCGLAVEIAKKAKRAGARQFVFFSTMAVYGSRAEEIGADTPPAPDTLYGKSKYKAEQQLQLLEAPGFSVAMIRPPMVYGPDSPGNYRTLEKFAPLFRVFPDTGNRRSMIEVTKLCQAVTEIIRTGQGGVFRPQDDEYHNTGEMIRQLRGQAGKKTCLTGAFNWLLVPFSKKSRIFRKVFGSQYYV